MLDVSSYIGLSGVYPDSSDDEFPMCDTDELLWLNQSAMRRRVIELAKEIELEELEQMDRLRNEYRLAHRHLQRKYEEYCRSPRRMDPRAGEIMRNSGSGHSSPAGPSSSPTYSSSSPAYSSSAHSGTPEYYSLDDRTSDSSQPTQEDRKRRSRLCRHFLKGYCKRGSSCDFLHDSSIFCPDQQKVFLGGLPAHVTSELLCQRLSDIGFSVINKPKVLRGFTPQVCLASVEEAQKLMDLGKIMIDGCLCDVRPYEDKKPPDSIKKSVFLGGLPSGLTVIEIKESLQRLGVKVCNFPIIKTGFSPQVVLETPEEAQRLVKMRRVTIGGKAVEVRPYVNFRKRY